MIFDLNLIIKTFILGTIPIYVQAKWKQHRYKWCTSLLPWVIDMRVRVLRYIKKSNQAYNKLQTKQLVSTNLIVIYVSKIIENNGAILQAISTNTLSQKFRCRCDDGYRCVLTGNMSDRKAYVFHCREREKSQHMYEFPHNQYRGR